MPAVANDKLRGQVKVRSKLRPLFFRNQRPDSAWAPPDTAQHITRHIVCAHTPIHMPSLLLVCRAMSCLQVVRDRVEGPPCNLALA